ncbi:hypothetical protein [Crocosphaera sp.]|nr:hypothetical protein [Crocosphaera sp.]
MARTKRLQLLLSEIEYETLKSYAASKQVPMSEVLIGLWTKKVC